MSQIGFHRKCRCVLLALQRENQHGDAGLAIICHRKPFNFLYDESQFPTPPSRNEALPETLPGLSFSARTSLFSDRAIVILRCERVVLHYIKSANTQSVDGNF